MALRPLAKFHSHHVVAKKGTTEKNLQDEALQGASCGRDRVTRNAHALSWAECRKALGDLDFHLSPVIVAMRACKMQDSKNRNMLIEY